MAGNINKRREKMPRSQRAKQFAPFKCLTGLEEALAEVEERHRRKYEILQREAFEEDIKEARDEI